MVNKILEKVISKLIAKKLGIKNGFRLDNLTITPGKDGYSTVDISCRVTVKDSDVLDFVDKIG